MENDKVLKELVQLCYTYERTFVERADVIAKEVGLQKELYDYFGYDVKLLPNAAWNYLRGEKPTSFSDWFKDTVVRYIGGLPVNVFRRHNITTLTISKTTITREQLLAMYHGNSLSIEILSLKNVDMFHGDWDLLQQMPDLYGYKKQTYHTLNLRNVRTEVYGKPTKIWGSKSYNYSNEGFGETAYNI
jgi:hypothetical protein